MCARLRLRLRLLLWLCLWLCLALRMLCLLWLLRPGVHLLVRWHSMARSTCLMRHVRRLVSAGVRVMLLGPMLRAMCRVPRPSSRWRCMSVARRWGRAPCPDRYLSNATTQHEEQATAASA